MLTDKVQPLTHQPNYHHWLLLLLMLLSSLLAWWLTPEVEWFEHLGKPQFEEVIPQKFATWSQVSDGNVSLIVNPQQQEALNDLYTQVVSRTYVQEGSGRRLMLSLAYGDNQTFSKQLHRPEACYSSQGFLIQQLHSEQILANGQAIEMQRMTAQVNDRLEQVSYFIRIGDQVLSGSSLNLNIARMQMGIKGYIADGLLFRVSEISDNDKLSYQIQDQFINDLLKSLSPRQQAMLIGMPKH